MVSFYYYKKESVHLIGYKHKSWFYSEIVIAELPDNRPGVYYCIYFQTTWLVDRKSSCVEWSCLVLKTQSNTLECDFSKRCPT